MTQGEQITQLEKRIAALEGRVDEHFEYDQRMGEALAAEKMGRDVMNCARRLIEDSVIERHGGKEAYEATVDRYRVRYESEIKRRD